MATNNCINTNFPVDVPNGGTTLASLSAYSVLCGGTTSTSSVQPVVGTGTTQQVLVSNGAGALPTFQNSAGGFTYTTVTTGTYSMVSGVVYITSGSGACIFNLPSSPSTGDVFQVIGNGSANWTINVTGTPLIFWKSTTGTHLQSNNPLDCVRLIFDGNSNAFDPISQTNSNMVIG